MQSQQNLNGEYNVENGEMGVEGQGDRNRFCGCCACQGGFRYLSVLNQFQCDKMVNNQYITQRMEQHCAQKKYSKISPALKSYFLHSLYFKCMTIKDAASRCKLNYSTAKVIIRDLTLKERKFVKRIIKAKETELKRGRNEPQLESAYRDIIEKEELIKEQNESPSTSPLLHPTPIEVICRTAFDFFAKDEKSNEE